MEERDHKKLGPELELFYIDQTVGKGLPMFLPKGAIVKRELEKFVIEEETKRGYLHVQTPDLARLELYEKSGHYPHYKDSMYAPIEIDEDKFMLRPMTCPHHFQLYLSKPHSYRELPMRIAELAQLYRYEQSGELMGLQRVRTFCLADAHIICASEEQAAEEVSEALNLIEHMASVFGLTQGVDYRFRLSLGDRANTEKYYKNDAAWEKGERLLREVLEKRNEPFIEAKDEAAFYGPKIDVQMKNVNGKEDTAFTVQYDFCMPDRFDLGYVAEDGSRKRAFVVHRSSIGAIERIMAFLIEKYAGAFPLWLAPVQVAVLPVGEAHKEYANKVLSELRAAGVRAEIKTDDSLGKRIREVKTQKIPCHVVVGDKEAADGTVSAENNRPGRAGTGDKQTVPLADFIAPTVQHIKDRANA
jgi:threonyl-tRNA synthetase